MNRPARTTHERLLILKGRAAMSLIRPGEARLRDDPHFDNRGIERIQTIAQEIKKETRCALYFSVPSYQGPASWPVISIAIPAQERASRPSPGPLPTETHTRPSTSASDGLLIIPGVRVDPSIRPSGYGKCKHELISAIFADPRESSPFGFGNG
ncbi:unnamed protein product [Bursaphelenchus xylophilus]|uniref:(pine wood nematode) hypothetical protein n=1 Tax=Bursaphelenchus xylophilus TaxID=6326 RepID=A0A1I7S3Z3_BURXY|nr:unnamed protein product [Bursaphelenchus xylophilus]CAG9116579.1 unnamed protein product [Bursaphelenchus xylophilus]